MSPHKPVSQFMIDLAESLKKNRSIEDTTASSYIRILMHLNEDKPFNNLAFLKNKDAIIARLQTYSESTQKSTLGTIVSVLTSLKDKPTYKTLYNFYYERMSDASKVARDADTTEKSSKQEANWITWDDVQNKRKELESKLPTPKTKLLTMVSWNNLLSYVILSLYTMIPPRRNLDYQNLYVVKKWNDKMDTDKNYYDLFTQKLIFNKYKTSKSHGQQEIDINDNHALRAALTTYINFHPEKRKPEFRLLVAMDGSPLTSINSITRILNKVFDKKIGSTMLRHVYLSDKYKLDMDEMKKDADAMGHNLSTQRDYIKTD
jgi:hypothetical protein